MVGLSSLPGITTIKELLGFCYCNFSSSEHIKIVIIQLMLIILKVVELMRGSIKVVVIMYCRRLYCGWPLLTTLIVKPWPCSWKNRSTYDNVRLRDHLGKLNVDYKIIVNNEKHFDPFFIQNYKDTDGNYTQNN